MLFSSIHISMRVHIEIEICKRGSSSMRSTPAHGKIIISQAGKSIRDGIITVCSTLRRLSRTLQFQARDSPLPTGIRNFMGMGIADKRHVPI